MNVRRTASTASVQFLDFVKGKEEVTNSAWSSNTRGAQGKDERTVVGCWKEERRNRKLVQVVFKKSTRQAWEPY